MLKKIFSTAMFICLGILAPLLLLELVFRLVPTVAPAKWDDRPSTYFLPADAVRSADFRYQSPKPAGTFRIAVVGDSFTFGPFLQFDDTFVKRMERWLALNAAPSRKFEVLNYGVPSYSTSNEVDLVSKALAEGADLILLQITLNDAEAKPLRPEGTITAFEKNLDLSSGLLKHSKLAQFIALRLHNRASRLDYEHYYEELFSNWRTFGPFKDALRRIEQNCRTAGVPVAAVVFPLFGHPVDLSYPFADIHRKIADTLSGLRIPMLDLLEAYRGVPIERMQVIPGVDRHPNEIAHRIAAEHILIWLDSKQLIPSGSLPANRVAQRIGIQPQHNEGAGAAPAD
ncbi:MAG: SGNH/GDSL hydrolase family protein [Oligoflexia bacterium]|nr:SGNH/GDSL hydrolase family protein [Oligoflexia bacterium]